VKAETDGLTLTDLVPVCGIINAVVEVAMTNDMPQPALSLCQAVDHGEWIRSNDPPETDAIEPNRASPLRPFVPSGAKRQSK
jgi:hypothetical protein